jgi:hypothetical protein
MSKFIKFQNRNEEMYYSLPDRHKVNGQTSYADVTDGEDDHVSNPWDNFDPEDLPRSKPQFLIDDDDEYQEQLELMWYKEDMGI